MLLRQLYRNKRKELFLFLSVNYTTFPLLAGFMKCRSSKQTFLFYPLGGAQWFFICKSKSFWLSSCLVGFASYFTVQTRAYPSYILLPLVRNRHPCRQRCWKSEQFTCTCIIRTEDLGFSQNIISEYF